MDYMDQIETLNDLVMYVRELSVMGLNSNDPKHWESALQDILMEINSYIVGDCCEKMSFL